MAEHQEQITILYVVNQLSSVGGVEKIVLDKADWLIRLGYRVLIVATEEDLCSRQLFFQYNPEIQFCRNLYKTLSHTRVDIVMFTRPMFREMALCRLRFPFVKYMLELHACYEIFNYGESYFETFVPQPDVSFRQMCDWLFPYLVAVIIVSSKNDDIKKWGYDNVKCIYNFTYLQRAEKTHTDKRENVVIAVGRYTAQKGFPYLIRAWKYVAQQFPNWHLEIWGDGEEKKKMLALIKQQGLQNTIHLMGFSTDLHSQYCRASLFVMSSLYEGFGIVLVEAQACGLPTVAFNLPSGPSDIINDGIDGYLCKYLDEKDLAEKLMLLMSNPNLRTQMSEAALNNARRFTPGVIMPQWDELFKEAIITPSHQPLKAWFDALRVLVKYLKSDLKKCLFHH